MDKKKKDEMKTLALIGTGLLTEVALVQSMSKSKTLTLMVLLGLLGASSFVGLLLTFAP